MDISYLLEDTRGGDGAWGASMKYYIVNGKKIKLYPIHNLKSVSSQ